MLFTWLGQKCEVLGVGEGHLNGDIGTVGEHDLLLSVGVQGVEGEGHGHRLVINPFNPVLRQLQAGGESQVNLQVKYMVYAQVDS